MFLNLHCILSLPYTALFVRYSWICTAFYLCRILPYLCDVLESALHSISAVYFLICVMFLNLHCILSLPYTALFVRCSWICTAFYLCRILPYLCDVLESALHSISAVYFLICVMFLNLHCILSLPYTALFVRCSWICTAFYLCRILPYLCNVVESALHSISAVYFLICAMFLNLHCILSLPYTSLFVRCSWICTAFYLCRILPYLCDVLESALHSISAVYFLICVMFLNLHCILSLPYTALFVWCSWICTAFYLCRILPYLCDVLESALHSISTVNCLICAMFLNLHCILSLPYTALFVRCSWICTAFYLYRTLPFLCDVLESALHSISAV